MIFGQPSTSAASNHGRDIAEGLSTGKNEIVFRMVDRGDGKPGRPVGKNDLLAKLLAGGQGIVQDKHPGIVEEIIEAVEIGVDGLPRNGQAQQQDRGHRPSRKKPDRRAEYARLPETLPPLRPGLGR